MSDRAQGTQVFEVASVVRLWQNLAMPNNPILHVLLRDLQICAIITLTAMVVMAVFAVPVTFIADHPEPPALSRRLAWNWLVGVANTAGSWILLTAVLEISLQWVPGLFGPPSTAVFLVYFMCVIVSIRLMWRSATAPPRSQPRQFSLKTLLITQLVIVVLCGLWIGVRRGEIDMLYRLQREQARQVIP